MNKEQQALLDEVYVDYEKEIIRQREIQKEEVVRLRSQGKRVRVSLIELLTQDEFINKCKTVIEFSQKWGLKIEERELSQSERFAWYGNKIGSHMHHDHIEQEMNQQNVPTKLITITYNDKTIESYGQHR